jgi:hypothetical protein
LAGAAVLFHLDSSNPNKKPSDTDWTVAVGAQLALRLLDELSVDLELAQSLAGYKASSTPSITVGPKWITNRHTFSIVVTNNPWMTADGYITNTTRKLADVVLGFNITREINL